MGELTAEEKEHAKRASGATSEREQANEAFYCGVTIPAEAGQRSRLSELTLCGGNEER